MLNYQQNMSFFSYLFKSNKKSNEDDDLLKVKFIYTTYNGDKYNTYNREEFFDPLALVATISRVNDVDLSQKVTHKVIVFNLTNLRWYPIIFDTSDGYTRSLLIKKIKNAILTINDRKISYNDINIKYKKFYDDTKEYFSKIQSNELVWEIPIPDTYPNNHLETIEQYGRDNKIDWVNDEPEKRIIDLGLEVFKHKENGLLYYRFYKNVPSPYDYGRMEYDNYYD